MKTCSKCGEEKPLSEFHKSKRTKDGHTCYCKPCANAKARKWQAENKERHLENLRRSREKPEQKARIARHGAEYRRKNAGKVCHWARKYQAARLQRTPLWADEQAIEAFYEEAKRLEELTGIKFHVDHIIPLQGESVSGLHVETNLQLLPAHENIGKSNSFDPQTFCA